MDIEQIIQIARDSWMDVYPTLEEVGCSFAVLERFVASIRAVTKEEDANICESPENRLDVAWKIADEIRASK